MGQAGGLAPLIMLEVEKATSASGRYVVTIYLDEDSESPREWDNLGRMICFHRRYSLGDEHDYSDPNHFLFNLLEQALGDTEKAERKILKIRDCIDQTVYSTFGDYQEAVDNEILSIVEKDFIILPLYLYDHGGITMRTHPFSCPWDSGQVGWIYVSKKDVRKEFSIKKVTKKRIKEVENLLVSEVKTYDQYLTGDVYGYVLKETNGDEIDSCWGFYGTNWKENGMAEYLPENILN